MPQVMKARHVSGNSLLTVESSDRDDGTGGLTHCSALLTLYILTMENDL